MEPVDVLKNWLIAHTSELRETSSLLQIPVNDLILTMMDDALEAWHNHAMLQTADHANN